MVLNLLYLSASEQGVAVSMQLSDRNLL